MTIGSMATMRFAVDSGNVPALRLSKTAHGLIR